MRLVERREPYEAVDSAFRPQETVGVVARDGESCRLQARLLARRRLQDLRLVAAGLSPAEVHAEEHLGPILRIRSPLSRMDRYDGVARVVLTPEECLLLEAVELVPQGRDVLGHLVELTVVRGQLHQLGKVAGLAREGVVAVTASRKACVLRGDRGRALLVVPEAGLPH